MKTKKKTTFTCQRAVEILSMVEMKGLWILKTIIRFTYQ
ncbi:hypothetical protein R3I94_008849 [Phoxinus phoxinus]